MSILGDLDSQIFLSEYWQQKPLLIKKATNAYAEVISPDELAGLACEEDIESRLISHSDEPENWSMENGPFPESQFAELPETNWTLLVQAVDQWLPEVKDILDDFDFLPSWRLDDVMISYAATGGGVGPHFDYYDVFLLQTRGRRRWRLGQQCDQDSPLKEHQPLKLLEGFQESADFELEPGDMLYIPAGLAHWGTALDDDCMTWSIGFRAPSAKELILEAADKIADFLPDDFRYCDSANSLNAKRGEINKGVRDQLKEIQALLSGEEMLDLLTDSLGEMATEPKYPELSDVEPWTEEKIDELFDKTEFLQVDPSARTAFRQLEDDSGHCLLYLNGQSADCNLELAQAVCDSQNAAEVELRIFDSEDGRLLLKQLLDAGIYLFDEEGEEDE